MSIRNKQKTFHKRSLGKKAFDPESFQAWRLSFKRASLHTLVEVLICGQGENSRDVAYGLLNRVYRIIFEL